MKKNIKEGNRALYIDRPYPDVDFRVYNGLVVEVLDWEDGSRVKFSFKGSFNNKWTGFEIPSDRVFLLADKEKALAKAKKLNIKHLQEKIDRLKNTISKCKADMEFLRRKLREF